jgi:hypothetical protein
VNVMCIREMRNSFQLENLKGRGNIYGICIDEKNINSDFKGIECEDVV